MTVLFDRSVRPPAFLSFTNDWPENAPSKQDLQKLWPHGVVTGISSTCWQIRQPNSAKQSFKSNIKFTINSVVKAWFILQQITILLQSSDNFLFFLHNVPLHQVVPKITPSLLRTYYWWKVILVRIRTFYRHVNEHDTKKIIKIQ